MTTTAHSNCDHAATRADRAACRKVRSDADRAARDAGANLISSMRGDEFDLITRTCRALTASCSSTRSCTRCNPNHDDHTSRADCAAALASLPPCSYCDSKGPWTASDIYRRNS